MAFRESCMHNITFFIEILRLIVLRKMLKNSIFLESISEKKKKLVS